MKVGIRKPSIKKSFKARTTGRVKRTLKSSIDPTYGKKGVGYIKNPKKAIYKKINYYAILLWIKNHFLYFLSIKYAIIIIFYF